MRPRAALMVCLALAACGGGPNGGGDETPLPVCSLAPTVAPPSDLPPGFPTPDGVAYTSAEKAGPSTILEGRWEAVTLQEAFDGYKAAFVEAGYQVTDEEQEATDAEVNFAGGSSSGQVRLNSGECSNAVGVGITIRPA